MFRRQTQDLKNFKKVSRYKFSETSYPVIRAATASGVRIYTKEKKLGSGTYGKVMLYVSADNKYEVVVKLLKKHVEDCLDTGEYIKCLVSSTNHVIEQRCVGSGVLVMHRMDGTLADSEALSDLASAHRCVAELVRGIMCVTRGWYTDIKPKNTLWQRRWRWTLKSGVKTKQYYNYYCLGDLDVCEPGLESTAVTTYAPPERYTRKPRDDCTESNAVFGMGLLIIYIYSRVLKIRNPYHYHFGKEYGMSRRRAIKRAYNKWETIIRDISPRLGRKTIKWQKFVLRMIAKKTTKRPSMIEVSDFFTTKSKKTKSKKTTPKKKLKAMLPVKSKAWR
uniref:Protein kinase domain-containing protein n=1 Tax=viral metagenome TaxID=1070528 RepID=A0A6C0KAP2_9ZZZZ